MSELEPILRDTEPAEPELSPDIRERLSLAVGMTADEVIEIACSDQIARWRVGERVPVEAYFSLHPAIEAMEGGSFELIYNEFCLRSEIGEAATLKEYLWRFPQHADRLRRQFALDEALGEATQADPDVSLSPALRREEPSALARRLAANWPEIEGYEVLAELGRGGMGVVYKARQGRLNRVVAIKMILADDYTTSGATERFMAEAEAVARLQHPNIVQIHGLGDQEGRPYFVMEYVSGGSLASQLDGAPRAARDAAHLVEAMARGIEEAHRLGVVHRDLKPANILMGVDGVPKVADFGVAKMLDADGDLTRTESILGSPCYMAPEQAEGKAKDVGPSADIYALGAIFYELLTGRPPFRGPTMLQTLEQVRTAEPVPPSRLQPGLSRDAETICLKCLTKAPARRYHTAGALAEDLRRFAAREPILARPTRVWERAWRWCERNPAVAGLSAAVVLATALGGGVAYSYWKDAETQGRLARTAENEAKDSRAQSLLARKESLRAASIRALDHSADFAQHGEAVPTVMWMLESLRNAPDDDPAFRTLIRRNLSAWDRRIHGLKQILVHPEYVFSASMSPDGSTCLTGGGDDWMRIWDVRTGLRIGEPWRTETSAEPAVFSPDGKRILLGGSKVIHLRDSATGKFIGLPMSHPAPVFRGAFSADGKTLATCCRTDTIHLWDGETGKPIGEPIRYTGGNCYVFCVNLSPDGKTVVAGLRNPDQRGGGESALRWDVGSGEKVGAPMAHPLAVLVVAYSPDGSTILTGCADGNARLWDARTGELLGAPMVHRGVVEPAMFRPPDARFILTGCADGVARWWDAATHQRLGSTLRHRTSIWGMGFNRDGSLVITGSADKTAKIWEVARDLGPPVDANDEPIPPPPPAPDRAIQSALPSADGSLMLRLDAKGVLSLARTSDGAAVGAPIEDPSGPIVIRAFSPDGTWIASGAGPSARTIRVWDSSGRPVATFECREPARLLAFSHDGRRLAILEGDQTIRVRDLASGREEGGPFLAGPQTNSLAFSPDGQTLAATTTWGPTALLWNLGEGRKELPRLPTEAGTSLVAFSPDGLRFLTVSNRIVTLWDSATSRRIGTPITASDSRVDARFSPDDNYVLTRCADGVVRLWSAATGLPVGPPMRHPCAVVSAAIDARSRFVVAACADGSAQLWDVATSRPIGPPQRPRYNILAVEFSADGRSYATTAEDGETRTWPIPEPIEGDWDFLSLRFRVRTAHQMDATQTIVPIAPEAWLPLRSRLAKREDQPRGDRSPLRPRNQ